MGIIGVGDGSFGVGDGSFGAGDGSSPQAAMNTPPTNARVRNRSSILS